MRYSVTSSPRRTRGRTRGRSRGRRHGPGARSNCSTNGIGRIRHGEQREEQNHRSEAPRRPGTAPARNRRETPMRVSARCTTISWIPSEAISGYTRMPFDLGITHYDAPPPDVIDDLEAVVGPDGARFGNRLSAWIEVEDGRIVGHGQDGRGSVSNSAVRLGGMRVLVEAVELPLLRSEPEVTEEYVRFTQTAGGRPGLPAPRRVAQAPYVKIE